MTGKKGNDQYRYIDSIAYNMYGSRLRIKYGNGTKAIYVYNNLNQQLINLKSYDGTNNLMQRIAYTYDAAKNITKIENAAGYVNVDLGGNYEYNYKYDNLYRLTSATGSFSSYQNGSCPFELGMEYSPSGNITQKTLGSKILVNGVKTDKTYSHAYQYNDRPHTVTKAGNTEYGWDANGNLVRRENLDNGQIRLQCWDEENRLTTVRDIGGKKDLVYLSSYLYNAADDRTWKLTGEIQTMWINGKTVVNTVDFDKTLYSSPYMVMNDKEYTKHYFIEGERVCSKLGGGFGMVHDPTQNPVEPIKFDYTQIPKDLWEMTGRGLQCVEFDPENAKIEEDLPPAYNMENRTETDQFFYHSDHLGSSSFITNINGAAVQHLQYLPFGETYVDQRHDSPYNTPYRFSGKEKDDETQYSYFGARYYDSDLSVFLSIDRFAGKYPSLSPYHYCANNPIILTDPTGDTLSISFRSGFLGLGKKQTVNYVSGTLYNKNGSIYNGKVKGFLRKTTSALNYIGGSSEGAAMLSDLENSGNVFTIVKRNSYTTTEENGQRTYHSGNEFVPLNLQKAYGNVWQTDPSLSASYAMQCSNGTDFTGGSGGTIYWNPNGGISINEFGGLTANRPNIFLGHELFHGSDSNHGLLDDKSINGVSWMEWHASYRENLMRFQLGIPYRNAYGGVNILKNNIPYMP